MTNLPFLADSEIAALCDGLEQPAAQVRYLKGLGLLVSRKPNGKPLVARSEFDRVLGAGRFTAANEPRSAGAEPNMAALLHVIGGKRHGAKAQGR